jgi:hypothetical protein
MITAELQQVLDENHYFAVRELPDGTVAALMRLMFTTAICTGLDYHGYAYRWCFEDHVLALNELNRLQAMDDEPVGFVARRGGRA